MSREDLEISAIDSWLQPMSDSQEPCGKDLEYDNDYLQLVKAAEGKPETQFGAGEPPNWREVRELSADLLSRSRDLRIALLWTRSIVNLNGLAALPIGLRLVVGLLENFWDQLHPLPDPDDGDLFARVNALAAMPQTDGLFGDLRQSVFFEVRGVGRLSLRAIDIALGQISAKPDELTLTKDQIMQMIASAIALEPGLRDIPAAALTQLRMLTALMNERFGIATAPDLLPIVNLIKSLSGLMPGDASEAVHESVANLELDGAVERVPLVGTVRSREDAVRAIDMVCEYLEHAEPSNPAQLMLRRARSLLNQNFLQLLKELAPEALNEVARVMGVDPDSIS